MKNYVLFLIGILCTSCLVSRMARPIITGRVLDYYGNPIAQCQVGEVQTDEQGYFTIPEKRYHEFTFIGNEAPAVHIHLEVKKEGYEPDAIIMGNPFGGAAPEGTVWDVHDIYLKGIDQKITMERVLENVEREVVYTEDGLLVGFPNIEKEEIPPTLKMRNRQALFDSIKKAANPQKYTHSPMNNMRFKHEDIYFTEYLDEQMTKDTTYRGEYLLFLDSLLIIETKHPRIKGMYYTEDFDKYFFKLRKID